MAILDLIIDLPKSAYTITDKPTTAQSIASGLMTALIAIVAFLDAFGWLIIDSVMALGRGVEWALDAAEFLMAGADALMIVAIAAVVGLLMGRVRTVFYVA